MVTLFLDFLNLYCCLMKTQQHFWVLEAKKLMLKNYSLIIFGFGNVRQVILLRHKNIILYF
jgi:hypothetical protein